MRPGALIIPRFVRTGDESYEADAELVAALGGATQQVLLGGSEIVGSAAAKAALWRRTGASAVDLESGAVARAGLPFVVLRAVCDPAHRDLPPAALIPLQAGNLPLVAIFADLLRRPNQLSGLLSLAKDAAKARRTLREKAEHFPPALKS